MTAQAPLDYTTSTLPHDEPTEVVIVGAGPAGLAVAACLRREGVGFTLLERESSVASSWRRHYDALRLHTPKALSALPYLPFPRGASRWPHRDDVVAYLDAYARTFDLRPRFEVDVRRIEPYGRHWRVLTDRGSWIADHVVLAVGHAHRPRLPGWPGLDSFAGPVLHSSRYRSALPFRGARVLVVGSGNSAQDVALDLLQQGVKVTWSVRGAVNVVPRTVLGLPSVTLSVALGALPPRLADALTFPLRRALYHDARRLGLTFAPFGPYVQFRKRRKVPLLDVGVMRALRSGALTARPDVTRFEGSEVVFADGRRTSVDVVILATGYETPPSLLNSPATGGHLERLHQCGRNVTPSGMLREIGLEARRIARTISHARRPSVRT